MPEIPASHRDLLNSQFATLATVGPDGRPRPPANDIDAPSLLLEQQQCSIDAVWSAV